jgi:hypothetical protein
MWVFRSDGTAAGDVRLDPRGQCIEGVLEPNNIWWIA